METYEQYVDKMRAVDLATRRGYSVLGGPWSVRVANCLFHARIKTYGELADKTFADLYKMRNMGRKSVYEVQEVLFDIGLTEIPPYRRAKSIPDASKAAEKRRKATAKANKTRAKNRLEEQRAMQRRHDAAIAALRDIQTYLERRYVTMHITDTTELDLLVKRGLNPCLNK
jgi:hypothetical protein